jgi:type II secretory pathway pseudopilin PulG
VVDLLVVVVVVAIPVLYAMDRVVKARAQTRRLRNMTDRLAAATARADQQQEKQQAVERASAELTSLMPAIKRPPLALPDDPAAESSPEAAPHGPDRARHR